MENGPAPRFAARLACVLVHGGTVVGATIVQISRSGARVELQRERVPALGAKVRLVIGIAPPTPLALDAHVVRHTDAGFGAAFEGATPVALLELLASLGASNDAAGGGSRAPRR